MYLIDTNVVSEARKKAKAIRSVTDFFTHVMVTDEPFYLSVISVDEVRHGVELIPHRSDVDRVNLLDG